MVYLGCFMGWDSEIQAIFVDKSCALDIDMAPASVTVSAALEDREISKLTGLNACLFVRSITSISVNSFVKLSIPQYP